MILNFTQLVQYIQIVYNRIPTGLYFLICYKSCRVPAGEDPTTIFIENQRNIKRERGGGVRQASSRIIIQENLFSKINTGEIYMSKLVNTALLLPKLKWIEKQTGITKQNYAEIMSFSTLKVQLLLLQRSLHQMHSASSSIYLQQRFRF